MFGKFFIFSSLFIILSCSANKPLLINTEIICPFRPSILVKFATAQELRYSAIQDFLNSKNSENDINTTVFRLKDGRSFAVKISPQQIIECEFRESPYGLVDRNYVHSF